MNNTCIIIGNGTSLNNVPIDFLNSYDTFGTNRIYMKYIPTYYVAVNILVIEQNRKDIDNLDCKKYVRSKMKIKNAIELTPTSEHIFCKDPINDKIYEGYTVTYVCLQLAYYMNYETVLLVGLDHCYQYEGRPNEPRKMITDDPNHFDPNYFKGQMWNNPDLEKSEQAYMIARNVYEKDGRRIINLTDNSALNVFDRDRIENWYARKEITE